MDLIFFVCVFLVSTKGSDHPLQTQTFRLSCHIRRWSGKQRKPPLFGSLYLPLVLISPTFSYFFVKIFPLFTVLLKCKYMEALIPLVGLLPALVALRSCRTSWTKGSWLEEAETLPHPLTCCSLLAGICCPRAARHSTAWCKWRSLCKWANIFVTSVPGSHFTFLFHL